MAKGHSASSRSHVIVHYSSDAWTVFCSIWTIRFRSNGQQTVHACMNSVHAYVWTVLTCTYEQCSHVHTNSVTCTYEQCSHVCTNSVHMYVWTVFTCTYEQIMRMNSANYYLNSRILIQRLKFGTAHRSNFCRCFTVVSRYHKKYEVPYFHQRIPSSNFPMLIW
jgi:hypothetical protein